MDEPLKPHDAHESVHSKLALLFKRHLEEQHHVIIGKEFEDEFISQHLLGGNTLVPASIFSNKRLSALEAIVKYLRENESLRNERVATLLGRSQAAVWITYRNATKKLAARFEPESTEFFIPTNMLATGGLSPLESVALYLYEEFGLTYHRIGILLKRDERTIWTVCSRARKKMKR